MQKYTATLTRDIIEKIRITSTCMITGQEFGGYDVDMPMSAGKRGFKRLKDAKAWVEHINAAHGSNTAIMG
ncbi:MAG: hypothetical protein EBZ49_03710 [Proteobacteria bacterium]|nr:hypothetical protein [Pseudomonadota bacterium]